MHGDGQQTGSRSGRGFHLLNCEGCALGKAYGRVERHGLLSLIALLLDLLDLRLNRFEGFETVL